jgi:UDP-N-acetylmuramoylalanine--D-glutamate ligase
MTEKLVILGGGESGTGAAILGKKMGYEVLVSEHGKLKDKYRNVLSNHEIRFEEEGHSDEVLTGDVFIKSPGIPFTAPIVKKIGAERMIDEIEFAGKYYEGKIVAITGSNGKTTTTLLTEHVLKKGGLHAIACGNLGRSFARVVAEDHPEVVVLEASSFQLDAIRTFRPHIAMILNITPDHLDRYNNSMEEYTESKFRITMNQKPGDYLIYNMDDAGIGSKIEDRHGHAKLVPISLKTTVPFGAYCKNETVTININTETKMSIQKLALQGKHNIYNSMAAGVAGRILELRKEIIRESLSDFQNIEHRLEYVTTVCGVKYINDSKATNINSTWYALESTDPQTIWIAGGVDKGNDYSSLSELVVSKCKAIICLGKDNSKIHEAFEGKVEMILDSTSMHEAVGMAYRLGQKGDTVLLSPACASFDLFENFEERGRLFKEAVRGL